MHLLGKHAQHEYGAAGVLAFDLLDQIEPASAGHRIIENRDIPLELAGELERVVPVLGLPDHGHVVLRGQDLFQTTPNHRVIVGDQDFHGEVLSSKPFFPGHGSELERKFRYAVVYFNPTGTDTVTLVPLPGRPLISMLPPKGSMRSRIPRRPSDFGLKTASSSAMPLPLSSTTSMRRSASACITTSTLVAFAWRATLVRSS